jgi:hypothetical protein
MPPTRPSWLMIPLSVLLTGVGNTSAAGRAAEHDGKVQKRR